MGVTMSFYRVTPDELALAEEEPERIEELVDVAYEREKKDGSPSGYLDKAHAGLDFLFRAAGVPVHLDDADIYLDDDGQFSGWDEETVAKTAQSLRSTSFDDLARHYDPVAMTEQKVYPSIMWMREDDEARKMLGRFFKGLVAFFEDAASRSFAAIKSVG